MLKIRVDDQIWLIRQPDHAALSGYLMAHWGAGEFARPGYYADFPDPERLRAETVFSIAEHDNGWWEWEADPDIDPGDGLPLHLTRMPLDKGLERWRLGVPRFEKEHPYTALLISFHAYWLYAYRCKEGLDPSFRHPLFGDTADDPLFGGEQLAKVQDFVREQEEIQNKLIRRMREGPEWAGAVDDALLFPHVRLLQLADGLSLSLCFGGLREETYPGIPRRNWQDRVEIRTRPAGGGRIICEPYPFDADPLPVSLNARVLTEPPPAGGSFQARWHTLPAAIVTFEFASWAR